MTEQPNDKTTRVNADELRQFVERFERIEKDKGEMNQAQKDVLAEAKSTGYEPKLIRKIVAIRKQNPENLAEEEAVLNLYRDVLGV